MIKQREIELSCDIFCFFNVVSLISNVPLAVSLEEFPILIRIKAAAWRFNQLDYCVLPRKQSIGPLQSPGKSPRPFMRPSKQIRRLLVSLLYNGQASFPTLLPFSGAGKFSLSAHPMPSAKFFTHNLSIKRHKVAFMRMWISYCSQTSVWVV